MLKNIRISTLENNLLIYIHEMFRECSSAMMDNTSVNRRSRRSIFVDFSNKGVNVPTVSNVDKFKLVFYLTLLYACHEL